MLTVLGSPRRFCDGLTRREALQASASAFLSGLGLASSGLRVDAASFDTTEKTRSPLGLRAGKAKSVIFLFLQGGAATQDMFDLKPSAPINIRGEFKPIATSVTGVQICEHLPLTARWMHKVALLRSVNHRDGCHTHFPCFTGWRGSGSPNNTHPPSMGSVCEWLRQQGKSPPRSRPRTIPFTDYVYMPCYPGWGVPTRYPGAYAGFLGEQCDPLFTECKPYLDPDEAQACAKPANKYLPTTVRGQPLLACGELPNDLTLDRLNTRRSLLQQFDSEVRYLDKQLAPATFSRQQQQAFQLLTSPAVRNTFDLDREPARLRDRYGRTLFGSSVLMARRLVEAGVRFVTAAWDVFENPRVDINSWDHHHNIFPILKSYLPQLDWTFSALLSDLEARGLLDETLVVVTSEMGRGPIISKVQAGTPEGAGREHWTYCYSTLLAGAGIRGGTVYGASDDKAAFVKDHPIHPRDIVATIYHCLGIDPSMVIYDQSSSHTVAWGGQPIREILS